MTKCHVCDRLTAASNGEMVSVWEQDDHFVCRFCISAADGPGRFEGNGDSLGLALVLDALSGISAEDHFLTDESYGYVGQFGRHLLVQDDRGFIEARSFASPEAAEREMNGYEDTGFGASEDDGWISYEPNGIYASLSGERLGRFDTLRRAQAAISVAMRKQGYYPNVFVSGEHGPSVRRIDVW